MILPFSKSWKPTNPRPHLSPFHTSATFDQLFSIFFGLDTHDWIPSLPQRLESNDHDRLRRKHFVYNSARKCMANKVTVRAKRGTGGILYSRH